MADRTQNINIVYKVNTVDVEKASASLQKAKTANDALVKSAQDLGVKGAAGAQQLSNSIAGLTLQMQQLKARIDVANQADTQRLAGLSAQYREMQTQLDKYNAALNLTATNTKASTMGLTDMYQAVRLLLTAGLVKELVTAALSMATFSGKIEGVKLAFDKLPNSVLLMSQLQKATHGMVDELTLMQKALQAKNFGIPIEKLGMLLEFATVRAQQTGISVDYLVDSIVTGLGRNSIKILDNLQINIGELKKRMQQTGETMQVVAIQMIGESMKKMDGYIETSETKVAKLEKAWKELGQEVSKKPATGSIIDFFSQGFANFTNFLKGVSPDEAAASDKALKMVESFTQATDKLATAESKLQAVQIQEDQLRTQRIKNGASLADIQYRLNKLHDEHDPKNQKEINDLLGQGKAIAFNNEVTKIRLELLIEYEKQLRFTANLPKPELTEEELQAQIDAEKAIYDERENRLQRHLEFNENYKKIILKQYDLIIEKLHEYLKVSHLLTKGSEPVGGFQGIGPGVKIDNPQGSDVGGKTELTAWEFFWDSMIQGFADMNQKIRKDGQNTAEDQRRTWAKAAEQIKDILQNVVGQAILSASESDIRELDKREKATHDYYDKQIQMAGDNEKAKERLRKKEDQEIAKLEREKDDARRRQAKMQIVIQAAQAIIKAYVDYGYIAGTAVGLAITAAAAYQLDQVDESKGYKEGVININGPGDAQSDSIKARLSKGESVMTAEETRNNMGLLKAIRAKKIDDRYISELIAKQGGSQQVFDDSRIVTELQKQKYPDLVRQGADIYEAKKMGDNARKYVRSKYLSS